MRQGSIGRFQDKREKRKKKEEGDALKVIAKLEK